MADFEEKQTLPYEADDNVSSFPPTVAREQSFYAAELYSEDPLLERESIEFDLSTEGTSDEYSQALTRWKDYQEQVNRDAVIDIVSDPSVDKGTKLAIVEKFKNNTIESENLRDAYILDSASEDTIPHTGESLFEEDLDAQEAWVNHIRENVGFADQTQAIKTSFDKQLVSGTEGTLGTIASIVFDALAPTDVHSLNSALIAEELGVQVDIEDLHPFVQAVSGPILRLGMFDFARNFLFNGTLSKKMGEAFDSATPEQQRKMMEVITEQAGDSFGTDFNKFTALQSAIDPIENTAGVAAIDFLGLVGILPVLGAVFSPIKTAKWYTTLDTGKPAVKPPSAAERVEPTFTPNVKEEVPSTASQDFVGPQQPPTGRGEVNATDNVVTRNEQGELDEVAVGNAEAAKLAEEARVAATRREVGPKIFVQTEQAEKRGNVVARINTAKIEEVYSQQADYIQPGNVQMPRELVGKTEAQMAETLQALPEEGLRQVAKEFHLVAEDKNRATLARDIAGFLTRNSKLQAKPGYKDFSKAYDKSDRVKAPEVVVDTEGNIKLSEGALRYAVMRDKGVDEMAFSMSPKSVLNAHNAGLITDIARKETILNIPQLTKHTRTAVPPSSPAGILAAVNPVKAANKYAEAIMDNTGEQARHMGTDRGEVIADGLFTKLDVDTSTVYPNVYQKLKAMDNEMHKTIKQAETNPLIVNPTERGKEVDEFLQVLKGIQGGVYNQANSTLHMGRVRAEGTAVFGRTADYGWNDEAGARVAQEYIQKARPDFETRVVQMGEAGQWYVHQDWNKPFNQAERWFFGANSMDSRVLGLDTSALSRTAFGDSLVFPKTMRGDPDFAKAGLMTEYKTSDIESKFFSLVRKEVLSTPHWKELNVEFNNVQENGRWLSPHELKNKYANSLSEEGLESLANSYYFLKRGTDYLYDMVNILDRNEILRQDMKAIVHSEKAVVVGYAKEVDPKTINAGKIKTVWDFDTEKPVMLPSKSADGSIDLNGRKLVQLRNPVRNENSNFQYALIGGKTDLGAVPARTLPRIQGWMPRRNTEAWYVSATPTRMNLNGVDEDSSEVLVDYARTVGAGATKKEADLLIEKLKEKYPNHKLSVREAAENVGDNALTDYQLYSDTVRSTRKRGDRLPTLSGYSRLEEPVQAFVDSSKIVSRNFAEQDHREAFERDFMKSFGEFVPAIEGRGKQFPNAVTDLRLPRLASEEDAKRFKVAQRLLIQFKDQKYTSTAGDTAFRDIMNAVARKLEDVGIDPKYTSEPARELAKAGNPFVRIPKTITSHLYLYLNGAQWFVQTQQLIELSAVQPSLLRKTFTQVPAIATAILARAPHIGYHDATAKSLKQAAQVFSGMDAKEFDELVDIIYNSGLPQSIDLNQMLHGIWENSKFSLEPGGVRQARDVVANTLSLPGRIGKQVGYGPAELAGNIGSWLFAQKRWQDANPGKDWRLPENVARITANAWDINHSMTGRSGSMEFQKGLAGLAMQFFAVQVKGFMQLLSSKTLSVPERVKMGTARLALYGMAGVPLGGVAMQLMDKWVDESEDQEVVDVYQQFRGGMIDASMNTMFDLLHADIKDFNDFTEEGWDSLRGKGVHDLQFSKRLSPVPEGIPQYEFLKEMYDVATGEDPNGVRFPFVNALGSLGKAVEGLTNVWRASDQDTPEKVIETLGTFSEASSLGNNYNKAMAMQIARDKMSQTGQRQGLGEVTLGKQFAQFFGVTTREEEFNWKIQDLVKEREAGIKERADDIMRVLVKMQALDPNTFEYQRQQKIVNSLIAYTDEGDREAVQKAVDSATLNRLQSGTLNESLGMKLWSWHADKTSEEVREGFNILRRSASRNPKMKEMLDNIERTGFFEEEE